MSRSWQEREARKKLLAQVPWIKRLKVSLPCDAIKYGHMSLRDLRALRTEVWSEKYRCKIRAYWQFKALTRPNFPATSGNYCYQHLMHNCLYYNREETARFDRWYKKWQAEHEA